MENNTEERKNLDDFLEEADLKQYKESFRNVLKVTKLSQLKFVVSDDLVQIGLSKPEQRRYKKIYTHYFPTYISKIKKLLSSSKRNESNLGHYLPHDLQPFPENTIKVPTKHIISIEDITLHQELGMGQFGVVQLGTWTTGTQRVQVAIKCLGHERLTSNSTEFLKEAAVMHSIEHPNIVRLFGVVLHLDTLMLVTELAPLRSLLECLREVTLRSDFAVPNLCEFAEQICEGMAYLEYKRLIHRDLAARNILVFSKNRVKISDFGLSRALGVGQDYYRTNYNMNLKLPVAWCAPECILFLRFTSASDVWAFGVCLWEMFTYGFQPWAALSGQQILDAIDAPHFQRLERPECCPQDYYVKMLECWSHAPGRRPTFNDLVPQLRSIRPDQVQATANFEKSDNIRRSNFLDYKVGQKITVLGREDMTNTQYWYGVLPGGASGMFDPNHVVPYVAPERCVSVMSTLSSHPTHHSSRSLHMSLSRRDVTRHTYTAKRSIQRSMISSPQGDVKHTSHVGLDGAFFGDISFLDPACCSPRQVLSSYTASKDLEQVPLINPNSPSHLTGASGTTPYPMLASQKTDTEDEVDLAICEETVPLKRNQYKSSEVTAAKILNKVKNVVPKGEVEIHEYHEISDTDTESASFGKPGPATPNAENNETSTTDFSQSLLDQMELMFRNYETRQRDEPITQTKASQESGGARAHTIGKFDKKKAAGTMKPMSAHDEKTLNTAVALANEITSKSMKDLDSVDKKHTQTSSDYRSKFHFKLPHILQHGPHSLDSEKDKDGKQERRNFSDEAKSVPDIQATLTAESKQAYTSLIEEPTPSTSLAGIMKKNIPEHLQTHALVTLPGPQRQTSYNPRWRTPATVKDYRKAPNGKKIEKSAKPAETRKEEPKARNDTNDGQTPVNALPLPPRGAKPPQVDMRRHVRRYPLLCEVSEDTIPPVPSSSSKPLIYQNTKNKQTQNKKTGKPSVDVADGATNKTVNSAAILPVVATHRPGGKSTGAIPKRPGFINIGGSICYDPDVYVDSDLEDYEMAAKLFKDTDYVSVEDLLEFFNRAPGSRERGIDSDEIKIMGTVLQKQFTPEDCLRALDLMDWNVYEAIKLARVKLTVIPDITLEECKAAMDTAYGDIVVATAIISMKYKK